MSLDDPNIWGEKSDGRYSADLIGWRDEQAHTHAEIPEQENRDIDGLIIRVTDTHDPERVKVFTVYKASQHPGIKDWLRLITIIASYYGLDLSYDLE